MTHVDVWLVYMKFRSTSSLNRPRGTVRTAERNKAIIKRKRCKQGKMQNVFKSKKLFIHWKIVSFDFLKIQD